MVFFLVLHDLSIDRKSGVDPIEMLLNVPSNLDFWVLTRSWHLAKMKTYVVAYGGSTQQRMYYPYYVSLRTTTYVSM
jgi:hypothetical protein